MRNPTIGKKKRTIMLDSQHRHCACCKVFTPSTADARHDTATNRMLCPACMILISNIRASLERGVTFEIITKYLDLPILDLPVVACKPTAAEKRAAGRQAVTDGAVMVPDGSGGLRPMTVGEYDAQYKRGSE